jgi:branched-chain amino acid transport system ATP-binding protein
MLEIKNIHKSFGDQKVLQGLSMSVEPGRIHTIIGGNGSGKTTLFNLITGFLKADKGEIRLNGHRVDNRSPVRINKKGITRTFQDLRLITKLSVRENILLSFKDNPGEQLLNALLPGRVFKKQYTGLFEKTDQILEKIHLKSVESNLAGEISYGQQKLLTLGCCIANDARLMLLDEPIAGIDKQNYVRIVDLIMAFSEEGRTILQIEHNKEYIRQVSDHVFYLIDGVLQHSEN